MFLSHSYLIKSLVRGAVADGRRLVSSSVRVWTCFALAFVAPAGPLAVFAVATEAESIIAPSDASPSASPESVRSAFRLGDAARPFGWATVVADFNGDGQPDVAVADHVARRVGGYEYRIHFTVSGQTPQDVTFQSAYAAVTVTALDVDGDHELDVVARAVPSGEPVGVWLNDRRFTRADVRQFAAATRAARTLAPSDTPVNPETSALTPRSAVVIRVAVRLPVFIPPDRLLVSRGPNPASAVLFSRIRPRAPPQRSAAFLS